MKTKKNKRYLIIVFTVLFISGCAKTAIFKDIPILEDVEAYLTKQDSTEDEIQIDNINDETVESDMTSTQTGDIVAINNNENEKIYDVKVEKLFHAASSRKCIYFFEPDKPNEKKPTGLACLNDENNWIKIPLKIIKS